jgi:hypothetical protein
MSWCSDAPEDEAISLFAGLLANPDVSLIPHVHKTPYQLFREVRGGTKYIRSRSHIVFSV